MDEKEADWRISQYRALLKKWTMCVFGIEPGDSDAMERQLELGEHELNKIAAAFPSKAYSVDLLVNARKRTWAGYEEERIERFGQIKS